MNKNTNAIGPTTARSISAMLTGLSFLVLSACTTVEKAPIQQSNAGCSFLGADCARLTTGGKEQAGLRYVNPNARWSQYTKVLIDPVTFWGGDTTQVSASDQQTLVNFFHEQLKDQLGEKFQVVDKPGPGVMKISVAMQDAESATPVLRSISMIIPQAHMLSNLKYLATGTFPFVGAAQAALKVTDSMSGQTLAAAVDRQIGGGSFTTGFQWQWGDAENAIKQWSQTLAERLSAWTTGSEKP